MNLIGKIIISLLVAGVVYGAAQLVTGLPLFLLLLLATLGTALLTSFPVGGSPAKAPQAKSTSGSTPKRGSQNAKKPAPRETKPKENKPKKDPVSRNDPAPTASGPREEGEVKWFNISKGFGFITKDNGEEIFVHFRSIRGEGRRGLKDGQRVSFVHTDSDKGPQAEDVEAL